MNNAFGVGTGKSVPHPEILIAAIARDLPE
jgi:hypothetical protein